MISTPLPVGSGVPKKVRKLALESGIPASLRGKVWAWMLASNGSTRTPGLYSELISRETEGVLDEKTEHAIQTYVLSYSHLLRDLPTRIRLGVDNLETERGLAS